MPQPRRNDDVDHHDHLAHALWPGTLLALRTDPLPARITAAQEDPVVPNT